MATKKTVKKVAKSIVRASKPAAKTIVKKASPQAKKRVVPSLKHQRIQTATGWKRTMKRKMITSKK